VGQFFPMHTGIARHQCLDGNGGQVVGAHRRQGAAVAAERSTDGIADVGMHSHGSGSTVDKKSWTQRCYVRRRRRSAAVAAPVRMADVARLANTSRTLGGALAARTRRVEMRLA